LRDSKGTCQVGMCNREDRCACITSEERGKGKTGFLAGLVRAVDDAYVDAVHVRSQPSMTERDLSPSQNTNDHHITMAFMQLRRFLSISKF